MDGGFLHYLRAVIWPLKESQDDVQLLIRRTMQKDVTRSSNDIWQMIYPRSISSRILDLLVVNLNTSGRTYGRFQAGGDRNLAAACGIDSVSIILGGTGVAEVGGVAVQIKRGTIFTEIGLEFCDLAGIFFPVSLVIGDIVIAAVEPIGMLGAFCNLDGGGREFIVLVATTGATPPVKIAFVGAIAPIDIAMEMSAREEPEMKYRHIHPSGGDAIVRAHLHRDLWVLYRIIRHHR